MRHRFGLFAAVLGIAVVVEAWLAHRTPEGAPAPPQPPAGVDPSYATTVQSVFDRRCVPCHTCFDSPCQVNLQSFEGVDRGGNKAVVYHPSRLAAVQPTRMFQDARTTAQWQSPPLDFFPVVDRRNPEASILGRFVDQRAKFGGGSGFDVDATANCPASADEMARELGDHPERGMPFGLPALTADERSAIEGWLGRGAGGPAAAAPEPAPIAKAIAAWESFLNGTDPKSRLSPAQARLVGAYVFEHLFYAHLYFDFAPGSWFRVVRSLAPATGPSLGGPIEELATRRPYDDPGKPFVYRLERVRETLIEKTHAPYELSDAKLAHLQDLFAGSWQADPEENPFDPKLAANPFVAFGAIPARARYQFLLDDARYHVRTFIHGPVCRGQAALDVIDEHFLIFFLSPDADPAVNDPDYLASVAPLLAIPADEDADLFTGELAKLDAWVNAAAARRAGGEGQYLALAEKKMTPRGLSDVWDGGGSNPHAVLTVYRHFDSAFVVDGAIGGVPKTAWVMDYPILERMYYDLVAGFDVFGDVSHQVRTRLYQNLLRIEAEGQFLRMLPASGSPDVREAVHDSWYRDRIQLALADIHKAAMDGPEPHVAYSPGALADPEAAKRDLVARLLRERLAPAVVGPREPIQWPTLPLSSDPARARFEAAMRALVDRQAKDAPYVSAFPDATLLRVRAGSEDLVYTVVRNRAHKSVELIWPEPVELEPQEDTLHVVPGILVSRPNLLLATSVDDLDSFVAAWRALEPPGKDGRVDPTWTAFVAKYGARRSDPGFWAAFDFFGEAFPKLDPIGAAVLDLSRYGND